MLKLYHDKIKEKYFFFFIFFLIIIFILVSDFILSNTILVNKSCYKFEERFYSLKKNCNGKEKFKKSLPSTQIYTDNLGLRVNKNNNKKINDNKDILIFGDSFTYGVGLEFDDTYVGIIRKNLKNFNVLNYAVPSYSPTVYYYKLKEAYEKNYNISKILIFLDLTDVFDEANRWFYDYNLNKPQLTDNSLLKMNNKNINFKKKNFKILTEISSSINFYTRILKSKISNSLTYKDNKEIRIKTSFQGNFTYTSKINLNNDFWKEGDFEYGINKIKQNLSKISKLTKSHNGELYLIIYPWAETLEYGQKEFNWSDFGKNICQEINCKLIDAIPIFQKYKQDNINWNNELYFINDEHFNKIGSRLLADVVLKNIN